MKKIFGISETAGNHLEIDYPGEDRWQADCQTRVWLVEQRWSCEKQEEVEIRLDSATALQTTLTQVSLFSCHGDLELEITEVFKRRKGFSRKC